jgi:hypothetical protein
MTTATRHEAIDTQMPIAHPIPPHIEHRARLVVTAHHLDHDTHEIRQLLQMLGLAEEPPPPPKPPVPPRGYILTDLDKHRAEMHAQGWTIWQIARAEKVDYNTIAHWLKRVGLRANKEPHADWNARRARFAQGLTDQEMADAEGITVRAIKSWRLRDGLHRRAPYTP